MRTLVRVESALDDRRHVAGTSAAWHERWELVWADPGAGMGGVVELVFRPSSDVAWFTALLGRRGAPPVVVLSSELTLPASATSLEVRGDGLWADHVVEQPMAHLSCNLEAFGVQPDTLTGLSADVRGVLVPFGYELDFVTDERGGDATDLGCRVEGIALVGADTIEVDGAGRRRHRWGDGPDSAPAGAAHLVDVLRDVVPGGLDLL